MNLLKRRRKDLQMTQEEVAKKARIPRRVYQSYELGARTPNVFAAIRIAKVLECNIEDIFQEHTLL